MKRCKKKGFTLIELVVVIIVIGVLATIGLAQYGRMAEKSRGGEARMVLGSIRTAEEVYRVEYGSYTPIWANLVIDAPTACTSQTTHYFSYTVASLTANTFTATATRCLTGTGRNPGYATANTLTLAANVVGNTLDWGGSGFGSIW